MRDLVVLVIVVTFFALCAAYVRWCDRLIGPDPDPAASPVTAERRADADLVRS